MTHSNRSSWSRAEQVHKKVVDKFDTYEAAASEALRMYCELDFAGPVQFVRRPTWFSFYSAVRGYSLRTDVLDFLEQTILNEPEELTIQFIKAKLN